MKSQEKLIKILIKYSSFLITALLGAYIITKTI